MTISHEARELFLATVNDGALYTRQAVPITINLARKMVAGTLDETLAIKAWRFLADAGAQAYTAAHDVKRPASSFGVFTVAHRNEAAAEFARYYSENVDEAAEAIKLDRTTRKRWTMSAIREASLDNSHFFFDPKTMRFFGDTLASFKSRTIGARVYVERVKRDKGGALGTLWQFDTETGALVILPDDERVSVSKELNL